ncbi:filamentous hemagglutinin N-terminal domain-containing protein [Xanthomonas sp. LMG 8992]|uniref:YDG domain-containing protein n=1 Tax=Xanthomonas sp. LMG 8992 TaxID=1591157 RepID=UPI00136EE1FB|nr:YDG domain-containing protein [Xanthomonas sp. LMG 8992]MXV11054.1 filamentous hemagglutinin N-terminal domain-containing protein [Xanthomonas sp. LMG 8992]
MNHIYRLVWSQVRRAWLVVSELARGRGKAGRTSTSRRTRPVWWAALPLSLPMLALATAPAGVTAMEAARPAAAIVPAHPTLAPTVIAAAASSTHPTGGQVTAGSGRIDYGDHLTTIQQDSQNLSLNWLSFNIGRQDTVNFLQPNAQSIAVNRIADPNGSMILGHLNANGQVFLINPNGVLFGQGAQVNAGGLVASTLDVSDSQLGHGTLQFTGASVGSVINLGTITAAPGGYVALLGHAVSNQGAIHAPAGSVALAGGSAITLSFDGNHLLDMQIDASALNALSENKQLIVADGGQVLMSAGAKDALLASVVNNSGTIQARTVENRAGRIVLLGGMEAGTTQVDGTLDASAPTGGDGGFVETSAAHVHVADGARISTLAATGDAGTWLIDPHDFTIAFNGGDMSGGTLSSQLGRGNVTIQSSQGANASGSGDIHVNDVVTWGANTLTLTAAHDVDINAVMTASGSAGLALNPSTSNGGDAAIGGGTVNVNMVDAMPGQSGRVDFTGGSNTLKINGQSYTIITTLGASGSTSRTDLQGINGALNCACYFALGANIDASATASWGDSAFGSAIGSGFVPIGHSFNANDFKMFTGTFDGLGHTISGLTINRPGSSNVGLFGYTYSTTTIRNIGLLGVSIQGQSSVGGLVGYNYGTISQAYATGTINGNRGGADVGFSGGANIGGLVGYNDSSGRISQAYASGAVSGTATVGGLIGYNNRSPVSQAYATGTVSSSGGDAGGLIGINNGGPISQAYATGAVSGSNDVGGLVGYNTSGTINQAYATGAVSGSNYVGGLVGINVSGTTISQVYATGAVSGTGGNVGGLIGANSAGVITNSYWDTETTGQSTSSGGTGLTTKALIAALPAGFTAARWGNVGNQTTPYLLGMSGNQVFNTNDLPSGTVTRSNRPNLYAVILDLNQLQAVNTGLAGRYVLGNDIDASASIRWVGIEFDARGRPIIANNGFRPIGVPGAAFTGVFDGLGHTINNLTINWPNTDYAGLFGVTGNGSAIRNLGLLGGSVTGKNYVGGLVGDNGGTITNTYATGAVSGANYSYVGGLVGSNRGAITNAYATGAVSGGNTVGGLVGSNGTGGTITNTYATGAVSGGNAVGGLVGSNETGGTITNTYATGAVSGNNSVGGLVGLYNGGTIIGSYWDTETTRQSTSDGGGTGLTTLQMMDPASFAAWSTDISAVGGSSATWRIYAGDTAPLLRTFMTGLAVTAMNLGTFYNGTAFAGSSSSILGTLTPSYWRPSSSVDATLILGDPNARTSTPATNAGSYALASDLYSGQMGYDIAFTPGTLTIAPAILTITANNASKTYGDTLTFAGNEFTASGLQNGETIGHVAFTSAGAAANAGVTGGPYTITSNAATGGSFNASNYAITYRSGSLTVGQAALTITANDDSKTYNGLAYTGGRGVTYSGFVNGETTSVLGGALGYAGDAQGATNAGGYTITPGGLTAGNYAITYRNGSLTVGQAALTVTANDDSKTYNGLAYTGGHGVTYSGFVNGETTSVLGGALGYAGDAQGATNAGSYTITPDGLTAGNYAITYRNGSLSVGRAALTVTANDDSKTYNGLAYTGGHGVTYSGFVNGETTSVLGGALGYAGDAQGATNAGSYTITPGGLTAGNYTITYRNGGLSVGQAALTVSSSNVSKTYDGGLSAIGTAVVSGGTLFGSDTLSGGNFSFTDKNVGIGKHVTIDGVTVSDGNSGGNYAVTYVDNSSSTITARGVTVDATGTNRVYDGGTVDAVTLASAGVLSGDTVNFTGTGSFLDKNVGTAKAVSARGIAASGADAGNYRYNTTASTTADITAKTITVDAIGMDKVYDGSTAATIAALGTTGLVAGDAVTFGNASAAFADKNAGSNKAVTVSGITAIGADAGNYRYNTTASTTADITAKPITVDAIGMDKVYDGSTAATIAALGTTGLVAGDAVTFGNASAAFADKNAGSNKTVTVSGITASGTDAGNYRYNTTANTTADIRQRGITVDATGINRVYDGSTVDAVTLASAGVLSGDTVNFTGTGSFLDKNVGTAKAVGVNGIAASGADAGNYRYNTTASTTADITAKPITVDAIGMDKVYDGSTAATITALGTTGLVAGDAVTFGNASAVFADKNAGSNKTVTVSGITASGTDAGNYRYNTTANTTADIRQRGITVDATGINRVYDGSTVDAVTLASAGVLSGDTVNFTGTGSFLDKNVGTAKAVSVSGIAASGADAGNYRYNTTANTTADIAAKPITVDAIGVDKVYDGSTAATIAALGTTGLVAGDAVTFGNASATFADKNAGSNKAVTISGITASGTDAGNYRYNTTANTTADIRQRGITVDATGTNRVYDGSTVDAVTLASAGVLSGDTVSFTGTGSFLDKNVGIGKTVSVFGITASGSEANNYSYNTSATTTADVTPATLTYRADIAHFKIGQMPGDLSGTVTGLVGGDTLADATDGTLTWQTPATAASLAGPYAIDGSGLSALNYLFEQAPGNAAALHVVDGSAPRLVVGTVVGLQRSSDDTNAAHAPYAPDVHIVDGGVRLP